MTERSIYITEYDRERLLKLIENPGALDHPEPECLENLKNELARAQVVAPQEIPPDVVTMNSTVRLTDLETNEEDTYTLAFPSDADIGSGRISVLAPIGTAILGYRVGDTLTWSVPQGQRRLRIDEVTFQPEASGNYDL